MSDPPAREQTLKYSSPRPCEARCDRARGLAVARDSKIATAGAEHPTGCSHRRCRHRPRMPIGGCRSANGNGRRPELGRADRAAARSALEPVDGPFAH
jgi:hypothetical protein